MKRRLRGAGQAGRAQRESVQGAARVLAFSAVLALVAVAILIALGDIVPTFRYPGVVRYTGWSALVIVSIDFAIAQLSFVRLGQRSDAEDVEFSALVLLVALFLVPTRTVFFAALLGTLVVNVAARRGVLKTIYNLAHRAFIVALLSVLVYYLSSGATVFARNQTIILFASSVAVFGFLEPVLLTTVVYLYRGDRVRIISPVTFAVASLNTAVGLLVAAVWGTVAGGAQFSLLAIAVYVAGVYTFAQVEQRAARAETLQGFVRAIDATLNKNELLSRSLPFLADAMRASKAAIYVFARDGVPGTVAEWTQGESVQFDMQRRQQEIWPHETPVAQVVLGSKTDPGERAWLKANHYQDAVLVPLFDSGSIMGAVVAGNRPMNDRVFDKFDVAALEAFASHLGVALERQRLYDRVQHSALHDSLTGLANRMLFHQRLDSSVFYARSEDRPFAVVMIDLDGFKEVNDAWGHQVGDELLVHVADRLRDSIRPEDTVARLGGDEFAVVLPNSTVDEAMAVASRLRSAFGTVLVIDGHEISVGASLGITSWEDGDRSGDDVLRRADVAMYQEKRARSARSA